PSTLASSVNPVMAARLPDRAGPSGWTGVSWNGAASAGDGRGSAVHRRRDRRRRSRLPGGRSGADRLVPDPLARGRGPERDRRRAPDAGGAERDAPPPRGG